MASFFCPLPTLQLITLTGEKTPDFLQGQVTCDVREVNKTATRRGAHCNPKGRVLATFRVLQLQAQYHLLVPTPIAESLITQLKKYAAFSKVDLMINPNLQVVGCVGEEIAEVLAGIFGELPAEPDQMVSAENMLLIRVQDADATPRFLLIADAASLTKVLEKLREKYPEKKDTAWQLSEINAGIPTIYPETAALFTPHMLNYPALNGVSFKKGCYTGQEVIARTQYLGQAKRHLYQVSMSCALDHLPKPGDALQNSAQENVGIVIDAVWEEAGVCKLLAVLQDEAVEKGVYWQNIALLF